MITELENGLIALIKGSPLGECLRSVGVVPKANDANLVDQLGMAPPAVYVSILPFRVADGRVTIKGLVSAVTQNARGMAAAKQGDGVAMGLNEIMWSLLGMIHGADTDSAQWSVQSGNLFASPALEKSGLLMGGIEITATLALPPAVDETDLAAFIHYHQDISLTPGADEPATVDDITLPQP